MKLPGIKWFLVVALIGLSIWIFLKKTKDTEVELPEPPKVDNKLDSTYIKKLEEDFKLDREIWEQQKSDMLKSNLQKDRALNKMQQNRKASNDHIKDQDLLRSIDKSLNTLDKTGY